jgi:hypothetical protein
MAVAASDLLLVTSEGCHLCEHARTTLASLGLQARELSVESEVARRLASQGVPLAFLPVLLDGTRLVAYGRLSERRLRKDLEL